MAQRRKGGQKPGLNEQQARFCVEYVKDFNGKQAAIRAGYAPRSAEVTASKLLTQAKVQARITKICDRVMAKVEVAAESVVSELARLAFSNMLDYIKIEPNGLAKLDLSLVDREKAAAIEELVIESDGRVRFKLSGKRQALETLGRYCRFEPPTVVKLESDETTAEQEKGRPEHKLSNQELADRVRAIVAQQQAKRAK